MTIAHAGHWLVQLAYLAPLAALGVALALGKRRERRARPDGARPEDAGPPGR